MIFMTSNLVTIKSSKVLKVCTYKYVKKNIFLVLFFIICERKISYLLLMKGIDKLRASEPCESCKASVKKKKHK